MFKLRSAGQATPHWGHPDHCVAIAIEKFEEDARVGDILIVKVKRYDVVGAYVKPLCFATRIKRDLEWLDLQLLTPLSALSRRVAVGQYLEARISSVKPVQIELLEVCLIHLLFTGLLLVTVFCFNLPVFLIELDFFLLTGVFSNVGIWLRPLKLPYCYSNPFLCIKLVRLAMSKIVTYSMATCIGMKNCSNIALLRTLYSRCT
ncbi:unnamed protein product [Strongylus vulgaris]|uniref:Uncharacterized protein n=1 Tax=Strongylus vulgaris TaxID=40348 RepID=A0A3P7LQ16_STRVU|nr:unnamed protein product [Strongylus vulgaris]